MTVSPAWTPLIVLVADDACLQSVGIVNQDGEGVLTMSPVTHTVIKSLSARADPTGRPREITFRRRQEIIDRLQTHTAPQNFTPKALYDGKAIMFASHSLGITGGAITVGACPLSIRPCRR